MYLLVCLLIIITLLSLSFSTTNGPFLLSKVCFDLLLTNAVTSFSLTEEYSLCSEQTLEDHLSAGADVIIMKRFFGGDMINLTK